MKSCPCGSEKPFSECCEPFLNEAEKPLTAEALMRSRYTAYTCCNVNYIIATTHPNNRSKLDPKGIETWAKHSDWKQLEILKTEKGQENDSKGTVEFIAYYTIEGTPKKHHEYSLFEKDNGNWYYLSGQTKGTETVRRDAPKIGRNDLCPCGSGKKYKKCCGA